MSKASFLVSTALQHDDLEGVSGDQTDAGVFDIDTGTLMVTDLDYLPRLAHILSWERYDGALRSPADDDSSWVRFTKELGGPFFGILWGDIDTPFQGDGTYRIKSGAPRLLI